MKTKNHFSRELFITDRLMEFFTEPELTTRIGYSKALWPLVMAKELMENGLDICESTDVPAAITVKLERDALTVRDNGPGIMPEIIARSLDYHVRISDKKFYISPTRGQLGNALKCLWAASFVANNAPGVIEVTASGYHHRIEVRLNRIAQVPNIFHNITPSVKKGTCFKMYWAGIASLQVCNQHAESYRSRTVAEALRNLLADFSAFNPHATFELILPDGKVCTFPASDTGWRKWRTSHSTSAHWYTAEDLRLLIAAHIKHGKRLPLRDFIGQFNGLSGTQSRKRVLAEAGLSASTLDDLAVDGDIGMGPVQRLLRAMQRASRPVRPYRLGLIGKEHLLTALVARGIAPEGFTYRKAVGTGKDGLPFAVEVAFGIRSGQRDLIVGLNHSPVFKVPSGHLSDVLADCHVQRHDPVVLLIHEACPRFMFADPGKGAVV